MSEDFGLLYRSAFTGSMVGAGPVVFSVWSYVVANGYGGTVDLHPVVLAATFGKCTPDDVREAIAFLCQPDPESRTETDDGRRLRHLGGVAYEIVNHTLYKSARALEERKAYNRSKKRESRDRARAADVPIFDLSKKTVTTADPLVLVSVSSPSGSDPEGVQGDHAPPAEVLHTKLGDWTIPPELYDEAEREHAIGRDELDVRVDAIRERPIPGGRFGHAGLLAYVRGLLSEWATWAPPKPKGARRSRPPAPRRGRAWVDESIAVFVRDRGWELAAMAKAFAAEHHINPDTLPPNDAKRAFREYLEKRARANGAVAA